MRELWMLRVMNRWRESRSRVSLMLKIPLLRFAVGVGLVDSLNKLMCINCAASCIACPQKFYRRLSATRTLAAFVFSALSDLHSYSAVRETVYRRRPGLPGLRTHHLEQPAGQRDICPVSVNLPSASKTFLFRASFPDIIIDPR